MSDIATWVDPADLEFGVLEVRFCLEDRFGGGKADIPKKLSRAASTLPWAGPGKGFDIISFTKNGGAAVFFSFGFLWFSLVFFGFSSGFLLFSSGFLRVFL